MKINLHWKLTAFFCSAVMTGLLLGYLYLSSHLTAYLEQDLQKNMKHEIALVRDFVETRRGDLSGVFDAQAMAHRMGGELALRVTIVGIDGRVLGDSDLDDAALKTVENHAARLEIRQALETGWGVSKRYSYTLKKYLLYVATPYGRGHAAGVIRLAMPLTDVEVLEAGSVKIVVMALCLIFIFSLGFTSLMAVIISRPLREMSVVARAMAAGDFSRKPSVRSRDELGDLARALTYMSDEVCDKMKTIVREGARLDAVIESMSEGLMVVDEKGGILLMNASLRKFFLISGKVDGRKVPEVIRNSVVVDMVDRLVLGGERLISREVVGTLPEERVFSVNAVQVMAGGKVEGAVLVFHDISALRRLEKVRQDFVANVSHELRTPVASIKGYAETLLGGAMDDPAALKEFLGIIHQNSDRLVSLINDLLDLARIESGKMKLILAPVDAAGLVRKCIAILEKAIADKRLSVSFDFPDVLPKALADEARLSQVFLNLLDNAVKYTPAGGKIIVRALPGDKKIRFEVMDSGIGIPEEDQPRIFERFYRVDKARSREAGGTGLGLSIVKHIVQAHGGDVSVHSRPGQGATFSFTVSIIIS
ncbi:MAG: ATP-binding protein [Candidatus Omnitrophota bacterium]